MMIKPLKKLVSRFYGRNSFFRQNFFDEKESKNVASLNLINYYLVHYPTPTRLTHRQSFNSLIIISVAVQFLSGIFLFVFYVSNMPHAFDSVDNIMRSVSNGFLVRYVHANGTSMFFIVLYSHFFQGLYYGFYSKPRQVLWCLGVTFFFLVIGAAFTGYVLPWSQASFWAATVVTNIISVLPGSQPIIEWIWGGCSINDSTLWRFRSMHVALSCVIITGIAFTFLFLFRKNKFNDKRDDVVFYPLFFTKDLFVFYMYFLVFGIIVLCYPDTLSHPSNYIPAGCTEIPVQRLSLPWYFSLFYTILRSIPHKTGGVLVVLGFIFILFVIPFNYSGYIRKTTYRPIFKIFYFILVLDFVCLLWIGQAPIKDQYILLGQIGTFYYFFFFLVIIPVGSHIESRLSFYKFSEARNTNKIKKIS